VTRWQRFRAWWKKVYGPSDGTLYKRGGQVRMPNVPPPPRATHTPPPPPPGWTTGGDELPLPKTIGPSGIAVPSDFLLDVEQWCEQAASHTLDSSIQHGLCRMADRAHAYRTARA
jgi:hypothetical protein